jgi:hypothetical protein
MDPYLEAHWRDVQARLIIYISDTLQGVLPGSLRARVEERVVLETAEGLGRHPFFPDVRVVEYPPRPGLVTRTAGAVGAAPLLVDLEIEPVRETFVEIVDRASGNRVVTVLEVLSPSNKLPGPDREQDLRKQREVCSSDANLVEINLNRSGIHTLAFPLGNLSPRGHTSYMTCVRRATRRDKAEVYPMPLGERLPVLKVPLRPDDADVPLDLQALIEQCYRNGAYEGTLNYAVDPDPPLIGVEAQWADEMLHEKGLRPRKKARRRKGD